jgi:hypothetical protein
MIAAPFQSFTLKKSRPSLIWMVTLSPRVLALALGASHLLRSWISTDTSEALRLELVEFRAEVTRAKATLHQTSTILEACNTYSSFLTWVIKLLAFSETFLLIWVIVLLTKRVQPVGSIPSSAPLGIQDQVESTSVESSPGSSKPSSQSSPVRTGPLVLQTFARGALRSDRPSMAAQPLRTLDLREPQILRHYPNDANAFYWHHRLLLTKISPGI